MRIIITSKGKQALFHSKSYDLIHSNSHSPIKDNSQISSYIDNKNHNIDIKKIKISKLSLNKSMILNDVQKNKDNSFDIKIESPSFNSEDKKLKKIKLNKNIIPLIKDIITPRIKYINIKNKKIKMPRNIESKYYKEENTIQSNFKLKPFYNIKNNSLIEENKNQLDNSSNDISLPSINKVYKDVLIKDIINDKNKIKMNKEFLEKKINESEFSLIKYLKLDRKINPSFTEKKIKKANNGEITYFNKLCERYFHHEEKNNFFIRKIRKKMELNSLKRILIYNKNLKEMSTELNSYRNICQSLVDKKNIAEEARRFYLMYGLFKK